MRRVLVVDDDQLVADTLTLIFGLWGYECRTAYSTDEALGQAQEFQPDLILCDINMPERDGLELMQEVRLTLPECRMIVLTGYTYNLQRVVEESSNLNWPLVPVLTKPCPPARLLREAGAVLTQ